MLEKTIGFVKKNVLALGIFFLGALFATNIFFLPSRCSSDCGKSQQGVRYDQKNIPRLSEMKSPSIDGSGASIAREDREGKNRYAVSSLGARERSTLPPGAWALLLAAYLFLIIFNLGSTFGRRNTVQWVWETIYTVLALAAWIRWDQGWENIWFPLQIMAFGVSLYLFYLYFFWEKQKLDSQGSDETQ
jgi:hypothetical protein